MDLGFSFSMGFFLKDCVASKYTLLSVFYAQIYGVLRTDLRAYGNSIKITEWQWPHFSFVRDPIVAFKAEIVLLTTPCHKYKPIQRGFVRYLKPEACPFRPWIILLGMHSACMTVVYEKWAWHVKIIRNWCQKSGNWKVTIRNVTITAWRLWDWNTCTGIIHNTSLSLIYTCMLYICLYTVDVFVYTCRSPSFNILTFSLTIINT